MGKALGDGVEVADAEPGRAGLHLGLDAEHRPQAGAGKHVGRRAVGDQAAVGEREDAVGKAGRQLEVVDGGDHRPPVVRQAAHAAEQVELVADVEVGRGLVEEQEGGVLRERLGEEHPLLLAARERRHGPVGKAGEVEGVERRVDARAVGIAERVHPAEVRRASQADDLGDGKVDGERGLLADERDLAGAVARRPRVHGAAAEAKRSGGGEEPDERAEERRLARAVGADEGDALALPDLERHVAEHRAASERDAHVHGVEEGRGVGHGRRAAVRSGGPPTDSAMPRPFRLLVLFAAALAGSSCGAFDNEAQEAFEFAAFQAVPDAFTETTASGEVVRSDPNDWRVGPAFVGRVQVLSPLYPNPASRSDRIVLSMYTDGVVGGMALYTINARGDLLLLAERADATAPGIYELEAFGSEAAGGGASGLYRLVVLDGAQRVLTYGDVSIGG